VLFSKLLPARKSRIKQRRQFRIELLESRRVMATLPYGALPEDTAEFMLGSVVVTPVFFESDGSLDDDSETWSEDLIAQTLDKIEEATDWWVQTLANLNTVHELSFTIDTTFANSPVPTPYEPIARRSNDYSKYVTDFLQSQGATTQDLQTEMFKFNNAQREKFGTDWSFTMIVVNSYNQGDGQFAPGGSFSRAFAFPGGLFMVVPSSRPASTFAHEAGHIFWARDEYGGSGSSGTYNGRRGYYNSQNTNAVDLNPNPNFQQLPSIMSSQDKLQTAWEQHISAPATLAQVGWQDSDGDGIFDVLDVPLRLNGHGYFDTASSRYIFKGSAQVDTLPNLNSSGYRSDITINKVRQIEYRFADTDAWQLYSSPNSYTADLDMSVLVPSGATEIQIRARDSQSTVTSMIFEGRLERADATVAAGINGSVWIDANKNGLRDVGEFGQSGWTVALVDNAGLPVQLRKQIEPNTLPDGHVGSSSINGAILVGGGSSTDGRIGVLVDPESTNGNKIFSVYSIASQSFASTFNSSGRQFQANFVADTTTVSLDAIGVGSSSYGRIEAYNSSGQLLSRYTTSKLIAGQVETMKVSSAGNDIAYVIASGAAQTSVKFDNLRHGPEASVLTGTHGHYYFPSLPAGAYNVRLSPLSGFSHLSQAGGTVQANVSTNIATTDIDFGAVASSSPWQNPGNRLDVNNNQLITATDALLIINLLNDGGGRSLEGSSLATFPYIDVNGDKRLSATDALLVINFLNDRNPSSEGEAQLGGGSSPGPGDNSHDSGRWAEGESAEGQVFVGPQSLSSLAAAAPTCSFSWHYDLNTAPFPDFDLSTGSEEDDLLELLSKARLTAI
jgi:Dockerin type I domain